MPDQTQVYADPASKTGYTKKVWDPTDASDGGKPTYYYEDTEDPNPKSTIQGSPANVSPSSPSGSQSAAASAAQSAANDQSALARQAQGNQEYNNRAFLEGVRQYNTPSGYQQGLLANSAADIGLRRDLGEGDLTLRRDLGEGDLGVRRDTLAADTTYKQGLLGQSANELTSLDKYRGQTIAQQEADRALKDKIDSGNLDVSRLDSNTKLRLGLRELQLREQEGNATDQRAREQNVMTYLGAISKLRLPYAELQALSQRAVAGIVPGSASTKVADTSAAEADAATAAAFGTGGGSAAPAHVTDGPVGAANGASGGGSDPTGALTADQWAALAQGTTRDWEQNQIGQHGAGLA